MAKPSTKADLSDAAGCVRLGSASSSQTAADVGGPISSVAQAPIIALPNEVARLPLSTLTFPRLNSYGKRESRLEHFDLLRGLAALLVLGSHLRAYIFQPFSEVEQSGGPVAVLVRMFYFSTGLGHQAVMIFFALSGFLVGGKALDDVLEQKFSWLRYLLRRLTRLWIVIVPSLALTLIFDSAGRVLTHDTGYDGRYYHLYSSGIRGSLDANLSMIAFLGNLAFLQTIYVPTFGSNDPLWSLANEFWYYIVFPLAAWLGLAQVPLIGRVIGVFTLLALLTLLPIWLLEDGAIWVAGAAAAWCSRRQVLIGLLRANTLRIAAATLLTAALIVSKSPMLGDLPLGLAVALSLPVVANFPSPGGAYAAIARGLSEISYTLYLTHFPFLTLIVLVDIAPMRWAPSTSGLSVYVTLFVAAIGWASIVWWCFERNTDRVYFLITKNSHFLGPRVTKS